MMFERFKLARSVLVLWVIIPFLTLATLYIYLEFLKTKEHVFEIIEEHLISEKVETLQKYINSLSKTYGLRLNEAVQNEPMIKQHLEKELYILRGNDVKYLYLLWRDKDGRFRYLLDATRDETQRAELNQKFDTVSEIWDRAYKTKQYQISKEEGLDTLWVTLACPIVVDGKVIAVLGADFTYDVYTQIVHTLEPMQKIFFYISLFMILMLLLAYLLAYLYYKTRKKSFIDPLTGAYNRQYLAELISHVSLKKYYLMMIDLDFFKKVNDNYGHDAGDVVLVSVVETIKENIRNEDVLIRFGGEEFLLFIHKDKEKSSLNVAQRIREAVKNLTIKTSQGNINMTLSLGVNPYPSSAKDIDEAIKIADEQLYLAKKSGRDNVKVFDEKTRVSVETTSRISDVIEAINEGRIRVAFQPIYSSVSYKIVKYEMLIRMLTQSGSITPPDMFLSYIRNTRVYITLTKIVLDKAIASLQQHDYHLSLNLDLQDILNDDIIALFTTAFKDEKELAKRLSIEILEHEEIKDFVLIKERIELLKTLGLSIALDDFGSGYANFRYMINLDLDILKIDGSLIQNIDKDAAAYSVVKSIVTFAKDMNMKVVAEQIETREELETLIRLEVDYLQGYYLGRPSFDFTSSVLVL